ncbi:RHS repeat-associated core domain-containing protein [Dyella acidisoli]|uniref:Teneurin-like YD-shell domain-containing protein n=1 Tax=Dyella acidisoli TaxID=1867834 RepID=A0ABQ5XU11_9GAMM|nr:RHS repeat-associated core domain-containing protein [Dyella acidisoli]GLQ95249.1 hypothetical protein GCM10007901_42040 [Dyella acidisoli]
MRTNAKTRRGGVPEGALIGLILALSLVGNASSVMAQTANTKTTYTYDALDRVTQVTDPSGLNTTYQYDGLSDPISITSPDSGVTARTYDAAGNVLTGTDAKGNTVTYTYDVLNRRLSASYADSTQNITYTYDESNSITGCAASYPINHLTRVVQNAVTTIFCYNGQGFVTQVSQTVNGHTDVTSYARSPAGRILNITHPSGNQVNYTYDANGRVSGVTASTGSGTSTLVSNVTYLPFGPVSGYTLGNGQAVTRTYDANYRLTDLISPAFTLHVARDAMGDITAIGNSAGANPATETYSYDPLYRLTAVTEADGSTLESVTYNQTGDRLSKAGSGLATGAYSYNTNTHQLTATGNAARTVDANGNTTAISQAGSTYGFGYNAQNKLILAQLNQSTTATYTYNADDERVAKTVAGTTERYNYGADSQLLSEYGATNREYVYLGDIPVANLDTQGATTSVTYVTADHLGAPRAVSDSSGNTVWAWAYQGNPWGEQQPTSSGYTYNLRLPGQYFDLETGWNYNGARYYDSATGRFPQPDPIGQAGGLGLYVYGLNNPFIYSDPDGLSPNSIWGGTNGSSANRTCPGVGKGGKDCEEQAEEDEAICRSLPNTNREESAIRRRCWASVQERFGACEAGRPLPPLVTWSVAAPDAQPSNQNPNNSNPNTHTTPVLPLFEPTPIPTPAPMPIFEPAIPIL